MTEAELVRAVVGGQRADYVYMYPPRQAYRPFADPGEARDAAAESVRREAGLNVYIHVPFCRSICGFCNLYAVADRDMDIHDTYVDAVLREVDAFAARQDKRFDVRTLYVGGGTPSLLAGELLHRLIDGVASRLDFSVEDVQEVSLEVAPSTVTATSLSDIRSAGFRRINLGIQSTGAAELRLIGRRFEHSVQRTALDQAMAAGFENVCVDLIYGLPAQTDESWAQSIAMVVSHRPETICAYPLTVRSGTGVGRRGHDVDGVRQYGKYDLAHELLTEAGYLQQTHVRWALPGRGGYLQKQYHWACETVIGFGAGARSYLWDIDTRNGYALGDRRSALSHYLRAIEGDESPLTDGIWMSADERRRKALILGLNDLDRSSYQRRFGADPLDLFPGELTALINAGLVSEEPDWLRLTPLGVRHRDIAVQPLWSKTVRRLVSDHIYDE